MNDTTVQSDDTVKLDPENPWLGLFSYTEENRAYFHGRDEEAAELARRVQRKLLTVLFGQSGLGKTSLLRAGLVPRLHGEGYCPVYVRIDYAAGSPPPSAQIKQAVFRATAAAGHWTQPGASVEGESLWEFLHHRGDLLRDAAGHTLTPLLIFDQFEEIFTLGQADDAGRARARQFLEDLADLVENRPPAALEKRLEDDDSVVEQFDFGRADYRVLITLREDYLPHLESVKDSMPSITQNRMRLARMHGAQALSAVLGPGRKLVSQEVAESIVRFVAGGSELIHAEIEPSLLSLVCRELNTTRKAQGRKEISADLLAGSRDTILSEFYERALADQPAGVRRVIEDELLTESGYRESLAEERVLKALAAAGAMPDALAKLVNHRLLRIEDRLDMRRVELTHDVLCSVVLASRNQRHAREAREETERQLAAQQEREAATHRALKRTRRLVDVFAVLLVLAAASAVFGFVNLHRAHVAEAQAQHSRSNAEKLVSFLIEDFYTELAPTGRLETLGKLAQKTVAYYDSLPPELVTPQTRINRAMALVREGAAQNASGHQDAAFKNFREAQAAFEKLRAAGDHGEPVAYGLALTLYNEGYVATIAGGPVEYGTLADMAHAADLLRPLARTPGASRRIRQLYADTLNIFSITRPVKQGVPMTEEARKLLVSLGALDLSDLDAAASYADASDSQARDLLSLGQVAGAQKLEQQVYAMTEQVLAHRPGDLHALEDRYFAANLLAILADRQHDDATTADYANKAALAGEEWVRFNPSDISPWGRWMQGLGQVAESQMARGEVTQAITTFRALVALAQDPRRPTSLAPQVRFYWAELANIQAQTGDSGAASQSLQAFERANHDVVVKLPQNSLAQRLEVTLDQQAAGRVQLSEGAAQSALANATAALIRIEPVEVPSGDVSAINLKNGMLARSLTIAAMAAIQLGRYPQAEALARKRLAVPPNPTPASNPQVAISLNRSLLAHAIAMQKRDVEARKVLQPALAYYEHESQAGAHDTEFRIGYAYALYVSAMTQPSDPAGRTQRQANLDQATALIAGASAEAQRLADMRQVSGLVAAARATPAG